VSVPVIDGWISQWNGYDPGWAGAVTEPVDPPPTVPELKAPPSAVAVWGLVPSLTTATVADGATVTEVREKSRATMVAPAGRVVVVVVGGLVVVVVGGRVVVVTGRVVVVVAARTVVAVVTAGAAAVVVVVPPPRW
jgi:hypothetical protein